MTLFVHFVLDWFGFPSACTYMYYAELFKVTGYNLLINIHEKINITFLFSVQDPVYILNLLEGGLEQLRRCVPEEASDTRFYPKSRWFSTDQATKSRRISKTVSRLGENSSSRPVPVFVEFKYSVIYGKMFFQEEITDAEVSTSYADY